MLRVGIALALVGCASAPPPPVSVSERDLVSVRASIARVPSDAPSTSDYHVSRIDVREREVTLELVAETRGRGWQRTDRAMCRRCADGADWWCARAPASIDAELPSGSTADVYGMSGDDAADAIRFLLEKSPTDPALAGIQASQLAEISHLRALSGPRICVLFGSNLHHAGTSSGQLVLVKEGTGFRVESVVPPPNWFEGSTGAECGVVGFEIPLTLRACER